MCKLSFSVFSMNALAFKGNNVIHSSALCPFTLDFVLYKKGAKCSYSLYGGAYGGKGLTLPVCALKCSHAVFFNYKQSDGYCDCLTKSDKNGGCESSNHSEWTLYRIRNER